MVWSWGTGSGLGLGADRDEALVPHLVLGLEHKFVLSIACGSYHCLAVTLSGSLDHRVG